MIIKKQDIEYKIDEVKLSKELTKLFHRNLCNTPGISKDRFIDWDSEEWNHFFINYFNQSRELIAQSKFLLELC